MKKYLKISGPGVLIAAAFIGPGTVTVCTLAGAGYGFALLWAMILSVIATIVLQEMAARIGLVSGHGLAQVIRKELKSPIAKVFTLLLILSAIAIGNAAYEAGNISGGVLGISSLGVEVNTQFFGVELNVASVGIGLVAGVLLYLGSYKLLERVLTVLVLFMSLAFVLTAIVTKPDIGGILKGSLIPKIPEGGLLTVIALVGTTVVPYNLFLHASLVREKWQDVSALRDVKRDTVIAIVLGGLVSISIIICAAALQGSDIKNAADLARSLEPLLGSYATYFVGLGLGAAGLTSAITAPLAASYVVSGCLGWKTDSKSTKFRMVWMVILVLGVVFSSAGYKPIEIIKFAQVANGLLLPIIAGYLLWIANKSTVLERYVNSRWQNLIGVVIWIIVFGLGLRSILSVLGVI